MWILSDFAVGILLLGLVMYAAFGGADFGGGIWTALSSGPRKNEQRDSLYYAIGPVWETNHVWLIFVVVVLIMVFPVAFSALFIALLIPFVLALVGINFRGAAFAFRHYGRETGLGVPFIARTFEISSVLTPIFLAMAVCATATGRIRMEDGEIVSGLWAWVSPFTLVGGLVGLAICAYLTPIYMAVRTRGALREDFRIRGILAALMLGTLTALQIPVAYFDAPVFFERLFMPQALTVVAVAVACGVVTEVFLFKRRFRAAQISAVLTVAATIGGFAAALYPDILISELTIEAAAAPRETLIAFFLVLPIGIVILVPSLFLLYWTFRGRPNPEVPPEG